jgi:hypothetical protein
MSCEHEHRDPARRGPVRLRVVGLAVLFAALAVLVIAIARPGSDPRSPLASCVASAGAPRVRRVPPRELSPLREAVSRIVPQRLARLYEEGAVPASTVWSDDQPQPPAVSPTTLRPAGYEMRWWAPNGDDLVADALVFADAASAQHFVRLASSTRCRRGARTQGSPSPPQAYDLSWLNPENVAQADVYVVRGTRVYRLADAPAGQHGGKPLPGSLTHAFLTIDTLACLLPQAHCRERGKGVPA